MNEKLILLLLIFLTNTYSQNKDIRFTHLTVEDGLSLNEVTKIIQDKDGFLWFGTYNGLNRYDGYNFKIFLPGTDNKKSISNHVINGIAEDRYGNIWIATLDGLNKYDKYKEKFTVYRHDPKNKKSISNNNILSIYVDNLGQLWVGTLDGLNKYNYETDDFTVIKKVSDRLNPDSLNSVVCIEEDFEGNLWLGTWNGLTCISKEGKVIKQLFSQPPNYKNFDYRIVSYLLMDDSKKLWIGLSNNGLAKYDLKTGKIKFYKSKTKDFNTISDNHVNVIFQDSKSNLWIGTKNGLNKYNPQNDNFIRFLKDPQNSYSIIDNNIHTICEDKTGILWIGTAGGISKVYFPKNKFHYLEDEITFNQRINSIYFDEEENFWLGTFEGVYKIRGNNVTQIKQVSNNANSLSDNYILSVYKDSKGVLWIGTHHSGLNMYNTKTKKFKLFTYDINDTTSISNNGITSILEDRKGNLWFATWWGLNRFDRNKEKFYRYLNDKDNPNSLPYDLVWVVFEDSRGTIWVGTDGGGAAALNPNTNQFKVFKKDSPEKYRISENRVISIYESSDGLIWFGTTDGLSCYDYRTDRTISYKLKDGLPGNIINGIIEDNKGFLWLSSDKGLAKFDRYNNRFYHYTKRSGLRELEFNQNTVAKDKKGNIYFACKNGIVFFNPDSIKDEYLTAPVMFTDLKIFNESVNVFENSLLKTSITKSNKIEIPSKYNVITIEFALLDFYNVKKNKYYCKLEGFDSDWNFIGTRNFATYTNLPPGEYKFIVKAYNDDGIRDTKQASLHIVILPAFYQTKLFKLSILCSVVIIIVLYVNIKTKRIKKLNKILEKKVFDRTRDLDSTISKLSSEIEERKKAEEKLKTALREKEILLKEIHHRVKNNLQVISSLLYLQALDIKDEELINIFKESQERIKCMALIHEKLYKSQDLSSINFGDYIKSLLEEIRSSFKRDKLNVNTLVQIEEIYLTLDTALSCGLLINEIVTNSFKYAFPEEYIEEGKKPNIEVVMKKINDNKYFLNISDNGVGIPKNLNLENVESLGLKLIYSIVEQLNGELKLSTENGTSYKIIFEDINAEQIL
ncbi:MAG: hypothetical protein N2249_06180 [Melioribacter sp.]|nr:hypothetical protein [Melioribacter sp.]